MSVCNCKKPDTIRLSDEEWEDEERNKFNMIRCCMCGGKWGSINLETNNISPFYGEKNKAKPTRYISRTDRYAVLKRQKWKCNDCGKSLKYNDNSGWDGELAHIDHIHPFSKWETYDGDINEVSNLQALCSKCNKEKYNKQKP